MPLCALTEAAVGVRKQGSFLPLLFRMHSKGRTGLAENVAKNKSSPTVQASSAGTITTTAPTGRLTGDPYDRCRRRAASTRS